MTPNQLSALIASAALAFSLSALAQSSSTSNEPDKSSVTGASAAERCEALTGAELERCLKDGDSPLLDQSEKAPRTDSIEKPGTDSGATSDSQSSPAGSGSSAPAPSTDTESTPQQK